MEIRTATVRDIKGIVTLINAEAKLSNVLPVKEDYIADHIRNYFVALDGEAVVGSSALKVYSPVLAEIRSVVVAQRCRNSGVGGELIRKALAAAQHIGIKKVFILTYIPSWFEHFDFVKINKHDLPEKIWLDCVKCAKFEHCDETAMILTL